MNTVKNNKTMQLQTAELQRCPCKSHNGKVSDRQAQWTHRVFLSLLGARYVFITHSQLDTLDSELASQAQLQI